MAENQETSRRTTSGDLFAKASIDPSGVAVVSQYVKVGRRWDVTHKDLLDKLIVIHQFTAIETRFGEALLVDLDVEGEQKTALFGAEVLKEQMKELTDHLPVLAVVIKPSRAYVLSDPTSEQIEEYKTLYL